MDIFEQASKQDLKFKIARGFVRPHELWIIPLSNPDDFNLDFFAKDINAQIKAANEESFVKPKSASTEILELKLNILKRVIYVRQEESRAKEMALINSTKKDRLLGAIAKKEDEDMGNLSLDELKAKLKEIE